MLEEERTKIEIQTRMRLEEKTMKHKSSMRNQQSLSSRPSVANSAIGADNGSFTSSKYPIKADDYRKLLKEKVGVEIIENNMQISREIMRDEVEDDNIFERVIQTFKKTEQMNNKKNYNKNNPWLKYEYHHTGTYVRIN
jgi:hypothetical protein